jgi:type II secretory pathway pseudopilin PulG
MLRAFKGRRGSKGFTLVETAATVSTFALLGGVLFPLLGDARRTARLNADLNNLRQLGVGAASYAATFNNAVPGFSWRPNVLNPGQTLPIVFGDVAPAGQQLRQLLINEIPTYPFFDNSSRIVHILYSHVPLLPFMGQSVMSNLTASPMDQVLLDWRATFQAGGSPASERDPNGWMLRPVRSSYTMPPAFYAPDREQPTRYIRQADSHTSYFAVGRLGDQSFNAVTFPSRKAFMFDSVERFYGRAPSPIWWPYSRVHSLMVDGSTAVLQKYRALQRVVPNNPSRRFNPGAYWGSSGAFIAAQVSYTGFDTRDGEWPVPGTANGSIVVNGTYRWTAGGKGGIDIGQMSPFSAQVNVTGP